MESRNVQEYLVAIYAICEDGERAVTSEIASRLGVAPPSVTEMLKKLAEGEYIRYEPYRGAALTEKGRRIARKIKRKHCLLERFLIDLLGIGKNRVHQQACEMEHVLSDEAEEALCRVLQHPDTCPDEKPIPLCEKDVASCVECEEEVGKRAADLVPLTSLRDGQKGTMAFIRGGRRAVQRLADMGLTPGTEITVVRSAPLHGPLEVSVRGSKLAIGRGLAMKVFIEVKEGG